MMTSLVLALVMGSLKIETPQIAAPRVELDLPEVPTADGLRGPSATPTNLTARKAVQTETMQASPAAVEEVQLSKSFVSTARGLKAIEPVDSFLVTGLPAQLPSFKACVRVSSPDKMPTRVKLQVKLPGGGEALSLSKTVAFDRQSADVVFDLGSLKVQHSGTYSVVVSLDGAQVAQLPLEIREIKQTAESSGR
jgi:hypothetical protein